MVIRVWPLHLLTDLHGIFGNDAVDRRAEARARKIELGLRDLGTRRGHFGIRLGARALDERAVDRALTLRSAFCAAACPRAAWRQRARPRRSRRRSVAWVSSSADTAPESASASRRPDPRARARKSACALANCAVGVRDVGVAREHLAAKGRVIREVALHLALHLAELACACAEAILASALSSSTRSCAFLHESVLLT